jgi:uncharacterized protein YndB with AHSA1/START domain
MNADPLDTTRIDTNRLEKTIDLKAPITRVWQALTDYKQFGTWFRVTLDGPFVVGQMSTGHIPFSACGHEKLKWAAMITRMDAPKHFAYTWHPYAIDPNVDYSSEPPTLVEFTLTEIPSGTRLTVVESGFDKIPAGRHMEALRMNTKGWGMQLENIKHHVED